MNNCNKKPQIVGLWHCLCWIYLQTHECFAVCMIKMVIYVHLILVSSRRTSSSTSAAMSNPSMTRISWLKVGWFNFTHSNFRHCNLCISFPQCIFRKIFLLVTSYHCVLLVELNGIEMYMIFLLLFFSGLTLYPNYDFYVVTHSVLSTTLCNYSIGA